MSAVVQPQGSSAPPATGTPASVAQAATHAFKEGTEPSAVDRLAASRARLRGAMMDIAHPPKREFAPAANLGETIHNLLLRVKTLPGAALVVDSIDSWWRRHPLRTAGMVAGEASRTLVRPIARRNPAMLLLGAAGAGALFMLTKPWRWLLRPALFVGLVPQIAAHALKRMPIETWMHMASSMTRSGAASARPATTPTTARPTPASPASAVRMPAEAPVRSTATAPAATALP